MLLLDELLGYLDESLNQFEISSINEEIKNADSESQSPKKKKKGKVRINVMERSRNKLKNLLAIPKLFADLKSQTKDFVKNMVAFNEELNALELVCQQHHDFQLEEWQKRQVQTIHSDNLKNQSKGIAQYLYIEQIFYIILGIISFAMIDRLSNPIDMDNFAHIILNMGIPINVTGVWLLLNIIVWILFVWLFHLLPQFFAKYCCNRHKNDLKIELLINKFINIDYLNAYLKLKHVISDRITTNHIQVIRTIIWNENDYRIWKGKLPKFEMIYDRKNRYLLSVTITIENNNDMWTEER